MTELEAPLIDAARQLWKDPGEPIAEIVDAAIERFERGVEVVVAALAGSDHLVGDGFSVADIVVGGVLTFARMSGVAELPADIVPYVDGLEARPARQRAYTRTA
jgi:glutathione S-transferase